MTQSSKPRIAVVGAGLIGRKHIELVAQDAVLAAVIDPDGKAKDLAESHGALWHADLGAYLAEDTPDGVIVASPNHLHLQHGAACIKRRIPVLIEKPLTDKALTSKELVDLSANHGSKVLVGHHRRHSSIVRKAKSIIEEGRLGRLVAVNALFWLNKPQDYFDATWRSKKGGGPIYINLIHDVDLLQHLCGPISYVQANEGHAVRGFDVEDTSAAILEFDNGVLGTASISDAVSAPWSWELTSGENEIYPKTEEACYMISGTKASMALPNLCVWSHTGEQSWWSPIESASFEVEATDPVRAQLAHFVDVIKGDSDPLVTPSDALRNIEVLDALKAAAEHGGVQIVGERSAPLVREKGTGRR